MTAFVSYARVDAQIVEGLRGELQQMQGPVWMDDQLSGGEEWWASILAVIRSCDLFILAMSPASLASEACMSETSYAIELKRPMLPVMISPVDLRGLPGGLARFQVVEYSPTTAEAGIRDLAKALVNKPAPSSLPDPLPDEPPMPRSYGDDYRLQLRAQLMTIDEQRGLAAILAAQIADPINGADARELLAQLRDRPDVALSVASRIDRIFAGTESTTADTIRSSDVERQPPAAAPSPSADALSGTLRVHRHKAFSGKAVRFAVIVDDQEIGAIRSDEHVDVDLGVGQHRLEIKPAGVFGLQYAHQSCDFEIRPRTRTVVTISNHKIESVTDI